MVLRRTKKKSAPNTGGTGAWSRESSFWALLLSLVLMQGEEVVELAIGELTQPAFTGGDREIG